jgi:putative holliday junction resolvase
VRLLGLDVGDARVGVAVSDPSGRVATPLKVLDARALEGDLGPLERLVEEYEVEAIVVGLPLTLAGEEGPQARLVRERVGSWASRLAVPIVFADERLTTAQARRSLSEMGLTERDARRTVDMVAAALILQGYLESDPGGGASARDGGDQ